MTSCPLRLALREISTVLKIEVRRSTCIARNKALVFSRGQVLIITAAMLIAGLVTLKYLAYNFF
jgi:hypothetical protein